MGKNTDTINVLLVIEEEEEIKRFISLRAKRGLKNNVELVRQVIHEAEEAAGIIASGA